MRVNLGKNIGYGLLFYVVVAVIYGISTLTTLAITMLSAGDSASFSGMFSAIGMLITLPVVALVLVIIIGIFQGKLANNKKEAAIAGGITGIAGSIILLLIIVGMIAAAIAVTGPGETSGSGMQVSTEIDVIGMISQFILSLIFVGSLGALFGFFSIKYIFPPQGETTIPADKTQVTPPSSQQQPVQPPQDKQRQTTQQKETMYVCPRCNAFVTQGEKQCPKCGTPLRWS